MSHPYVRPMQAGEIIAGAFRLYLEHLALLVTAALLPNLVLLGAEMLLVPAGGEGSALLLAFMLATVVVDGTVLAAITVALCRAALGTEPTLTQTYALVFRENLFGVILAYLIVSLLVPIGFLLLIIPGLLLGGLFAPAIPVVIVERRHALEALRRAAGLTRADLLTAVVVFSFFLLVSGILPLLLLLTQAGMGLGPFTPLLSTIIRSVTLPLGFAANVLLYFSLRAANGYDAEQLEAELERPLPE